MLTRRHSDGRGCYATLCSLASLLIATGHFARARAVLAECVAVAKANSYTGQTACRLEVCATLAASLGESVIAGRFHGAALARLEDTRSRHEPVDEAFIAPRMADARAAVGECAFDTAVEEGRAWSYEASVAEMERWLNNPERA